MAEVIFQNLVTKGGRKGFVVKSAGTHANVGSDMMDRARIALAECGEKLPKKPHQGMQFTHEMNTEYDHVIDLRNFRDPWGYGMEIYIDVCKELQQYCIKLYDEICKTL